ncbi:hypothetical protein [Capnocytophaga cynodegmi]|nr:hypothetical protein [Capnocytophaga cynodegmi]CEN40836.1 conserved hypothetical protein [Capnocytophaga cynodegmi]
MYRLTQKISDLYGYMCIDNHIYAKIKGTKHLQELSLSGEVLWQSKQKEIGHYYVNEDVIIFNLYNDSEDQIFDDLFIYDRNTKKIISNKKVSLNLYAKRCYYKNIFYNIEDKEVIIFDILKGKILEKKVTEIKGVTLFITEHLLISKKDIYIYIYIK